MDRRKFLSQGVLAGSAAAFGLSAAAQTNETAPLRIIGISCSPRKGKTTSRAVQIALEAAQSVSPRIQTQLIDLGEMTVGGWQGGATPETPKEIIDDYSSEVEPLLETPGLGGLIIGSPVYFRTMSSLCKALLERMASLRTPKYYLADLPVGAVAVGSFRNGGQELVIEQIHAAMLCHEAFIVGGKPKGHQGATLVNAYNDDITKDEIGVQTARQLGIRVAEAALKTRG
ncbi:MAG: flavodoxin family protein [Anaerohalosphaeraceae bacterium]